MAFLQTDLQREVATLLVEALNLEIAADAIDPQAPLYGEGLGLDSIDVLELVIEIERTFGAKIEDERTGMTVLRSVDTIAEFITRHRETSPA